MKEKPSYTWKKLLKRVPKEYHSKIEVFIKQNIDILLNHKLKNYEIELLESKQTFFMRNYKPLLEQEIETIKKYINKHFEKSFIRPSLSAVAVPVLLVRKLVSEFRFCIDYRAFNKITIKNQYILPLINKILRKLSSVTSFTKLDIIYAFNKI